jgi:hypothetical protein
MGECTSNSRYACYDSTMGKCTTESGYASYRGSMGKAVDRNHAADSSTVGELLNKTYAANGCTPNSTFTNEPPVNINRFGAWRGCDGCNTSAMGKQYRASTKAHTIK